MQPQLQKQAQYFVDDYYHQYYLLPINEPVTY